MSDDNGNDGDLALESDGERYRVLHQGHAIGSVTYHSSEKRRWKCACGKQARNRDSILAHIRHEHLVASSLPPLPRMLPCSGNAALYTYAGLHPDPTYDEVCYRLHLVG